MVSCARGGAEDDALWVIGAIILLFFVWWGAGGPATYEARQSGDTPVRDTRAQGNVRSSSEDARSITQSTRSPWVGKVKISSVGSARKERRATFEYIVIKNTSREPVTISGWRVQNGADFNWYVSYDKRLVRGVPSSAVIPNGVELLWESGINYPKPIVLKPREQAIISTGRIPKRADFLGLSFKVNKCSGYLNEFSGAAIQPKIRASCPLARDERNAKDFGDKCYAFLRRVPRCHAPDVRERSIDGTFGLPDECRSFAEDRLNYGACMLAHLGEKDFFKPEWRIYLNQGWELWDVEDDRIRLFDANGLLVHEIIY